MPLTAGMTVWPGDPAYTFARIATIAGGGNANVGTVAMCLHTGTHADAPFHVDDTGPTIEQLDLSIFLGPAVVLDASERNIIEIDHLRGAASALGETFDSALKRAPRLLLRTGSWKDRSSFPQKFATLSESAAAMVVAAGAVLLGVDVPSVDPRENAALPIHHTLIGRCRVGAGVQILESLVLDTIRPGFYELIAPPLKIVGADGSPVRALLIERG